MQYLMFNFGRRSFAQQARAVSCSREHAEPFYYYETEAHLHNLSYVKFDAAIFTCKLQRLFLFVTIITCTVFENYLNVGKYSFASAERFLIMCMYEHVHFLF